MLRLQRYMAKKGVWDKEKETQLLKEVDAHIEKEVQAYETLDLQPVENIFKYMYKEMTAPLKEQLVYQKQFERKSHG